MCIAIPAEVISIDGPMALVDVYGQRFSVSLLMMSEAVRPGDFVALQAQRYAVTRIEREEALAARRLFEDLFPELPDPALAARLA
jgi:hydrogenase expression/formation protein HypC